jgi:anti-sigma B factor antagonist
MWPYSRDVSRPAVRAGLLDSAIAVIAPAGEIDRSMMLELCALIRSLIDQHRTDVVLNLSRVEHVHYQGIELLVEHARRLRSLGGDLKLVGMSRYLVDVFRAVDADRFFDCCESLEVAVGGPVREAGSPELPSL